MKKLPLFIILVLLAGCVSIGNSSKITYTPELRKQSFATDTMFHDLLTAYKGVGYTDAHAYPNAKERTLVRVEVILPYDNHRTGSERWTIKHEAGQTAVYQVSMVPDGEGSAEFWVSKAE
jgi:hypothetical protein